MSFPSPWVDLQLPSGVTGKVIAASNSNAFVVDDLGNVYFYNSTTDAWSLVVTPPVSMVHISASTVDGTLLGIGSDANAYLFDGSTWSIISFTTVTNAIVQGAITDADNLVVVESTGAITRVSYTVETSIPSGPTQVSTTSDPTIMFGVDVAGYIYEWDEANFVWNVISGQLKQVHVTLVSGVPQVFGVDMSGGAWTYNTSTTAWSWVYGPNVLTVFEWVESSDGIVWALTDGGSVVYLGVL